MSLLAVAPYAAFVGSAQPSSAGRLAVGSSRIGGSVSMAAGDVLLDVQLGTACSLDQEIVTMSVPETPGEEVHIHRLGAAIALR